jgi:hypothetical protein
MKYITEEPDLVVSTIFDRIIFYNKRLVENKKIIKDFC